MPDTLPGVAPAPGTVAAPPPPAARRRAPKAVWWLLGVALVALFLVWALSPWWTLARMQRALRDRDAAAFSQYVDYPTVRENLKPLVATRVKAEITQEMGRYGGAAAGLAMNGLVEQVAGAAVAAAVDTAVTPAGMMALMMGVQAKDAASDAATPAPTPPPAPAPASADGSAPPRAFRFQGGYESPNRFGVSVLPPNGGEIRAVITRQGFATWRLTEIVPPP